MKKLTTIFLFVLMGCSNDPESKKAPAGTMLITINGTEMQSVSATAVVTSASLSANPRAAVDATYDTPDGKYIMMLSVSTQDVFEPIETGEYIVEGKDLPANTGIIYYVEEGAPASESYSSMYVGSEVAGKIVINSIDTSNKLISGSFECRVAHSDTGEVLTLSACTFTQIPYKN